METIFQDIRYGVRMLTKTPAFTSVAVLTLALGIGANTAIFTVVNALLLKMLPVKAPQELVVVGNPALVSYRWHGTPETGIVSSPLYREFRDRTRVFSGLAAAASDEVEVNTGSPSGASVERFDMRLVSGNYFSTLGVEAAAGRLFTENDDTEDNANPVVVLSYGYWKTKFARSPEIIGKDIRLNGRPFTVIGVSQPKFTGDVVEAKFPLFVPLSMQPMITHDSSYRNNPTVSWLSLIGRLKPGVSVGQAKADVNLVFQQALKEHYGSTLSVHDRDGLVKAQIGVVPGGAGLSEFRLEYRTPLILLMGTVGLVLLIACVNVSNLLLARATARSKEVAVRLAIGASRGRLLQQFLTESILLALLGGICGALLSVWGVRLLVTTFGSDAGNLPLSPDLRLMSFAIAVCVVAGVLFGMAPALKAIGIEVNPTLKHASLPGPHSRSGWGKGLVATQVALSLLVLFGAGLLVRSLRNLMAQDLGYDGGHIVVAQIGVSSGGYKGENIKQLAQDLSARLSALPGVRGVSYSRNGFFSGGETSDAIIVPGFDTAKREDRSARADIVGPDYFNVIAIPILLGRGIGAEDRSASSRVAVVNEAFTKHFFRGENPIGRQFQIDDPSESAYAQPITVIGVSKDAKDHPQFLRGATPPRFYLAFLQDPKPLRFILEIVTKGDPRPTVSDVRKQVKSFNPKLGLNVQTVRHRIESSMSSQIALAKLTALFAGLALVLASIGLYGLMSYAVASRTREIGVRIALGAQRTDMLQLILGEGMVVVGLGLAIGIPLSLVGGRVLRSFLFGLSSSDPLSLLATMLVLGTVAALAGFIPARRATKVDPIVALRYE